MTSLNHDFQIHEAVNEPQDAEWHNKISIAAKLRSVVLVNTLFMALLAAGMLGTMAYFSNAGETLRVMTLADSNTSKAALYTVQAHQTVLETSETEGGLDVAGVQNLLDQSQSEIELITSDEAARLAPEELAAIAGFQDRVAQIEAQLGSASATSEGTARLAEQLDALGSEIASFAVTMRDTSITASEPVFSAIQTSLVVLIIAGILLTAGLFFGARLVVKNISGGISEMTSAMQAISDGDVDTPIPGRDREDEIGAMARALAVFRASTLELRGVNDDRSKEIERQLQHELELNQKARELRGEKGELLADLSKGFEQSVGDVITAVSAASDQLESTSKSMVKLAEESAEQTLEATKSMAMASDNVTAAAAATDEFALSIAEISKQATASATLARETSTVVDTANTRMNDLAKAADEIGEIADLIQTIAQRTNLLALNASIEAARGGEAGRGFAVVASEVKELAMQTSNATNNVAERIQAMQTTTTSSVSDLNSIVDQINKLEQTSVMIASAVDQQSMSGDELARNIDIAAKGASEVRTQLDKLRESSLATGSAAAQVLASASELGLQADNLSKNATSFISDVRRSSRDLQVAEADLRENA